MENNKGNNYEIVEEEDGYNIFEKGKDIVLNIENMDKLKDEESSDEESNSAENAKSSDHKIVEEDAYSILEYRKNVATEDAMISNSAELKIVLQTLLDVVIRIHETVRPVSTVPTTQSLIYRTPEHVRSLNTAAYTPRVVSIGPYHHGDIKYEPMEGTKKNYCRDLIARSNKMPLNIIISRMRTYERLLRDSYEDTEATDSETLLDMVLVDGCFILEYMLKSCYDKDTSQDINYNHDILLQENQIPFQILKLLFKSTSPIPATNKAVFANRVRRGIKTSIKCDDVPTSDPVSTTDKDKVLDEILVLLVREFFKGIKTYKKDDELPRAGNVMHITDLIRKLHEPKNQTPDPKYIDSKFTTTATQLHGAGVKFKAVSGKGLLDIEFKGRCLEIPAFEINENSLSLYKNLLVLEHCHYPSHTFITDYFVFMGTLIDSSDDVNLLVRNGVLFNRNGHYSDTANIFNNFCGGMANWSSGTSYLMPICAELDAYYKKPIDAVVRIFKHDYFGNTARVASSLTAVTVIVLTFISTIYTVLSYKK